MTITGLTPTICPGCEAVDSLLEIDRQTIERQVAGFNVDGDLEYLPNPETLFGTCYLECKTCGVETAESEVYSTTFPQEEE